MRESMQVPEPDIDGFIEWVENEYTDERWSDVYKRGNNEVVIWSGKYPAFQRFQKDLKPKLHKHGLVMQLVNTHVPRTIDGEICHVHWVAAKSMRDVIYDMLIKNEDWFECDTCGNNTFRMEVDPKQCDGAKIYGVCDECDHVSKFSRG